jgi:tryptophanyl-tRNA synthetase
VADLADPSSKMSKSAPDAATGVIRMLDGPDLIRRKINRAVTDSGNEVRYDPESKPGVSNLLDIVAVMTGEAPQQVATGFATYGALKAACTECVISVLEPIQRRYSELDADRAELKRMLREGAASAREQAAPVLARASSAMGLPED